MHASRQAKIEDKEMLREYAEMSLLDRAVRKWRQGELFEAALRSVVRKARQQVRRVTSSDLHYVLDSERVLNKRYSETFATLKPHHKLYGNYYLDSRRPLDASSVIYSFGIGGEVSFDRAISTAFGCPVYMYDPTPSSIARDDLMRIRDAGDPVLERLKYHPVGAWSKDTVLRFNIPARGGCASAVEDDGTNVEYFDATCESVKTMMAKNGHTKIDVLKMDIEGAAEAVLEHLLDEGILPGQVVAEFERPRHDIKKVITYFGHMEQLCQRMRAAGYEITFLPRSRAQHFGLELLFARV